jgi:hypothetical protein
MSSYLVAINNYNQIMINPYKFDLTHFYIINNVFVITNI